MSIVENTTAKYQFGSSSDFKLITPQSGTIYALEDTHQLFIGQEEYTKGTKKLAAEPTDATAGEIGVLYAYNGNLYLYEGLNAQSKHVWTRVANVNDSAGTVTSITIGEGLANSTGDANPITTAGTIKHAVPTGAEVTTDSITDQAPDFGESFNIEGIATDKFGHVTGVATHTVTLPDETALSVTQAAGTAQTPNPGDTISVVTGVVKGDGSHDVTVTTTNITLPDETDTTYTLASSTSTDGGITVTPSEGAAYDVVPKGWDDLAKKSDITSVFKFKGTKATVSELPTDSSAKVGDVWAVTAENTEYVCIAEAIADPATPAQWEEFGPDIDLSAYALSADVIQRLAMSGQGAATAGNVPKIASNGTLQDSGFTLGTSVPADAVFTDTTYENATTTTAGLMSAADKVRLDGIEDGAEVNAIETVKVAGTALVPDANKAVDVTLAGLGINVTAQQINESCVWTSFAPNP